MDFPHFQNQRHKYYVEGTVFLTSLEMDNGLKIINHYNLKDQPVACFGDVFVQGMSPRLDYKRVERKSLESVHVWVW